MAHRWCPCKNNVQQLTNFLLLWVSRSTQHLSSCFLRSQPSLSSQGYQSGLLEAKKGIQGRFMACLEDIEIVCVCFVAPKGKHMLHGINIAAKAHLRVRLFSRHLIILHRGWGFLRCFPTPLRDFKRFPGRRCAIHSQGETRSENEVTKGDAKRLQSGTQSWCQYRQKSSLEGVWEEV